MYEKYIASEVQVFRCTSTSNANRRISQDILVDTSGRGYTLGVYSSKCKFNITQKIYRIPLDEPDVMIMLTL